jgi:hypothetical protein
MRFAFTQWKSDYVGLRNGLKMIETQVRPCG